MKRKKNKKQSQKKGKKASSRLILPLDYCQIMLMRYHSQFTPEIINTICQDVKKTRLAYWGLFPYPIRYEGWKAWEFLDRYLEVIEEEISKVVRQHSIYYWLHLYRRLKPALIGEDNPITIVLVRNIMEAAFLKYGGIDEPEDMIRIAEGDPVAIMNGKHLGYLGNEPSKPKANNDQFILKDFSFDNLVQLYRLESLAQEYWRTTALMRIIGKGAPLIIDEPSDPRDGRSDNLNFLVEWHDNRIGAMGATSTGIRFQEDFGRISEVSKGCFFAPIYNVSQIPVERLMDALVRRNSQFIPQNKFISNFIWIPRNLDGYYNSHKMFSEAYSKARGVDLEEAVFFISTILLRCQTSWLLKPFRILNHFQRAYEPIDMEENLLEDLTEFSKDLKEVWGNIAPSGDFDLKKLKNYFTLSKENKKKIALWTYGPRLLFIPYRNHIILDYLAVNQILEHQFVGIRTQENFKGPILEDFVSSIPIPDNISLIFSSKKLSGNDNTSREIDCLFGWDKLLILCECKARNRPLDLEKGKPDKVEDRFRGLAKGLDEADDKGKWLSEHPKGTNYNISSYDYILPLLISPFLEFIWNRSANLWIDDMTPRILNPELLSDFLNRTSYPKDLSHRSYIWMVKK